MVQRSITSLNIESYRGIRQLELNDLSAINILVGKNNAGKSSVLEAIRFFEYPESIGNVINISRMRNLSYASQPRLDVYESFINLFDQTQSDKKIQMAAEHDGTRNSITIHGFIEKRLINIENHAGKGLEFVEEEVSCFHGSLEFKTEDGGCSEEILVHKNIDSYRIDQWKLDVAAIKCEYLSPVEHVAKSNFGDIIKSGKKSEIIAALKLMEPQISGLELIEDVVYLQNENSHMLPLSVFGDGLKKIMALAAGVIRAKDGILLVDELETAIHTSVLKEVFSWLVGACREFNVQLFFTTHSIETVDAVLNCGAQVIREDLLRVITLVKKENKTVARVLSGEKALQVRGDYDMELRK